MATRDELLARAQREDQEWHEARLHEAMHHNWLSPDECATCLAEAETYPESPYLRLTPMARQRLGVEDYRAIAARAESMGTKVGVFWGAYNRHWICTANTAGKRV